MNKFFAVVALGAVAIGSVATAMSSRSDNQIDEARVQAKIDARLHDLLVKARMERLNH